MNREAYLVFSGTLFMVHWIIVISSWFIVHGSWLIDWAGWAVWVVLGFGGHWEFLHCNWLLVIGSLVNLDNMVNLDKMDNLVNWPRLFG